MNYVLEGEQWRLVDPEPEIRMAEDLLLPGCFSHPWLLDVEPMSPTGRTKVTLRDDFGASFVYVLVDYDAVDRTFGLRWPD